MNPREIEEMSWRMAEVYEAVVNRILINMARHFQYINAGEIPSGTWLYQTKKLAEMGQVTKETEQIILTMLGDADGVLRSLLEESILNGLKDAEPALRKAAEAGLLNGGAVPPLLDPSQMQAFRAFYEQSADSMNLVNTVMLESTTWAYQATVADIVNRVNATQGILNVATGEVVTGVSSWNDAIRRGVQDMVKNGITGFVDHGGHRWSPEAYVAMDVRSTMANTARAAVWERCDAYGDDLYQVSWHNAARPLCFPWQSKVISRSDTPREVMDSEGVTVQVYAQSDTTYGQAAGLFGVNCGHYPIPFIPGFSRIRQPHQNEEENAKAYEDSQKQRYLERKLREEKRDLEVMKAQGASEDELKNQKQRIRDASDNIDEFCAKTGRARRRNRETAPVRATWPTDTEPVTRYNGGYISATATPPPKGPLLPNVPKPTTPTIVTPTVTPSQIVARQATQAASAVVQSQQGKYRLTSITGDYADKVQDIFEHGDETARKAWEKFIPDGGCIADAHYKGSQGPHFDNSKIYLDVDADAVNKRGYGCTFFHENGHAIDCFAGWLSSDADFTAALNADFTAALKATGKRTKKEQYSALGWELVMPAVRNKANGVSDICEGLSGGKCKGGYGHGTRYWRDRPGTGVQREAFAHMYEAAFLDGQREMIEKYFPTAYDRFIELLRGVT